MGVLSPTPESLHMEEAILERQSKMKPHAEELWLETRHNSFVEPQADALACRHNSLAGFLSVLMHLLSRQEWDMPEAARLTWIELLKVLTELMRTKSGVVDREDFQGDDGSCESPLER